MKLPALALTLASSLCAQSSLYFDGNGASSGESNLSSFDWDTTTALWTTDSTGNTANVAWTPGATAILGLSESVKPSRTLQLTDTQSMSGITTVAGNAWTVTGSNITSAGFTITAEEDLTISSNVQATGALTASVASSKTLTLSGTNTFAGGSITGNTLSTVRATAPGSLGTGTVSLNNGVKLDSNGQALSAVVELRNNAQILNAGSYTGTVKISTMSNAQAYSSASVIAGTDGLVNFSTTGTVTVDGGFLEGTISTGATTLNSGRIRSTNGHNTSDVLTINGDLTVNGGFVEFSILNTSSFSKLVVDGTVYINGGYLNPSLQDWQPEYSLTTGDSFQLISADSITGSFENITASTQIDLGGGRYLDFSTFYQNGTVIVSAVPEPAAFAALSGLTMLALAATRRRSRSA